MGYWRVSTGAQELDKNKADLLQLASQEDLGRMQFVEEKVSGKVPWRKRRIASGPHGVSIAEAEDLFKRPIMILPDPAHSQTETRMRAIGKTKQGCSVFIVFTIRKSGRKQLIRPISARYLRAKEVKPYEEENSNLPLGPPAGAAAPARAPAPGAPARAFGWEYR